jgi:hypothetical protein
LRAESKFVKLELYDQVDFCPFRGPDAPFALKAILARQKRKRPMLTWKTVRAKAGTCDCTAMMWEFYQPSRRSLAEYVEVALRR